MQGGIQHGSEEESTLRMLKHDIKNQLSNIHLALDQLKYELPDAPADCLYYIDTIATSAVRINELLKNTD